VRHNGGFSRPPLETSKRPASQRKSFTKLLHAQLGDVSPIHLTGRQKNFELVSDKRVSFAVNLTRRPQPRNDARRVEFSAISRPGFPICLGRASGPGTSQVAFLGHSTTAGP
jgi:hypothetical protein